MRGILNNYAGGHQLCAAQQKATQNIINNYLEGESVGLEKYQVRKTSDQD